MHRRRRRGRAALGNLWFVRQASHLVDPAQMLPVLAFTERIELTRRHLGLLIDHYGEGRALVVGRKYVAWTIRAAMEPPGCAPWCSP